MYVPGDVVRSGLSFLEGERSENMNGEEVDVVGVAVLADCDEVDEWQWMRATI